MSWEKNEQRLCSLIQERRSAVTAENEDFPPFQDLVAALKEFERAALIEHLDIKYESMTAHRYAHHASWRNPATKVTIGQRRWLVLRFFATRARENDSQMYGPSADFFAGLAGDERDITKVCEYLRDRGFMTWNPLLSGSGFGRISDQGHEALEIGLDALKTQHLGTGVAAINILNDNRNHSVSVGAITTVDGAVTVGQRVTINNELLTEELKKLIQAVEAGQGSEQEKITALRPLREFLSHPLVTAVVGGAVAGSLGLIG